MAWEDYASKWGSVQNGCLQPQLLISSNNGSAITAMFCVTSLVWHLGNYLWDNEPLHP